MSAARNLSRSSSATELLAVAVSVPLETPARQATSRPSGIPDQALIAAGVGLPAGLRHAAPVAAIHSMVPKVSGRYNVHVYEIGAFRYVFGGAAEYFKTGARAGAPPTCSYKLLDIIALYRPCLYRVNQTRAQPCLICDMHPCGYRSRAACHLWTGACTAATAARRETFFNGTRIAKRC